MRIYHREFTKTPQGLECCLKWDKVTCRITAETKKVCQQSAGEITCWLRKKNNVIVKK